MAAELVINTGPLITLARVGLLDLIGQLPLHVLCPAEVRAELDAGERAGHLQVRPSWVEVVRLKGPLSVVTLSGLDPGETAVIELALERKIPTVCIDEWKGRRLARAAGLQVVGSLGLLGRAKVAGLLPELRPWIERALEQGIRYHPELVERVLAEVGEAS